MVVIVTICVAVALALGVLLFLRKRDPGLTLGDDDGPLETYRASSVHEAHLVAGLMQQAGLSVTIRNEQAFSLVGELPPHTVAPTIWVRGKSDFARARAIVEEYEERLNDEDMGDSLDWRCESCDELSPGNFEACWKCGKPRSRSEAL